VHASDLTLPEGVSLVGDPTRTIVTVLPPSIEAKPGEVPAEGAAPAAPEAGAATPAAPEAEAKPAKKSEG
jgi:hypothetical protein